jgi:hypothetical protein
MKTSIPLAVLIGGLGLAPLAGAREWIPPRTSVFIMENGRFVRVVEPEFHFANARRDYQAGNLPAAADNVRRGAAVLEYLGTQPGHVGHRRDVEKARADLDRLAALLLRGKVTSTEYLDARFSSALASLGPPRS